MDLLRPVIRPYPWGTRTAIAELQGRPVPAPGPEAELWMGAHPSAPSGVDRAGTTLDAVIAAAPDRELGAQCEAGFAAENERGLAPGDPGRNYVDDWPKPELLYALTPFEVAAGLRTPADASALLRALQVDELEPLAAALAGAVGEDALGAALAAVLEWPEPCPLVASVVAACQRLAASDSPFADACAAAVRVA